jgi:beta-galactosidase
MPTWTRRQLMQGVAAAAIVPTLPRWRNAPTAAAARERLLLDRNWRFHFGHASDPARDFGYGKDSEFAKSGELFSPSSARFDASAWRALDLPHDWAVELPYVDDPELNSYGDHPVGRDFPATSVGWYRRVFTLPASDAGRRISLDFDGIFRDATIALNGRLVGRNASGYAPYHADISDIATYGGTNVLVVRVDATEREGWFYEGAGIYRHTWLTKTTPVHVAHWGTFVTTTTTRGGHAVVGVATDVDNDSDDPVTVRVRQTLRDPSGSAVISMTSAAVRIGPWDRATMTQRLPVSRPALWSVATPSLYTVDTVVESANAVVDHYTTPFGIRTMRFDANTGFWLNDQRVELQGTCNHQDHAGVGSALPDRLQSYRVERLKAMGCNAYRTSHNPPTPELLDACDRLGLLVLDETRMFSPEPEGLSQLERMVRRDRNHPSVFAWSLANEEGADQGNARGARMISTMRRHVRQLDPTRPVTAAMNGGWGKGFTDVVDVQGFNYFLGDIDAIHHAFPAKPMMGTEVASTLSTRGIYANDKQRGYMSAYDVNKPGWGATAEGWWPYFAARPFLAGGFVWTGFDYRGEPTPYEWPCTSSHFGIMDTCGFPKDNFYYYRAWWDATPSLHLFPHWNWAGREGQPIDVWVHANVERVELLLNGTSLGTQQVPRQSHVQWTVPYAPGTIEARGFHGDTQVLTDTRVTTGPASAVTLRADRATINADGQDVAVIIVQVVDAQGRVVPTADDQIVFAISGAGTLIGVGNGNPSSHEPDKGTTRQAFNGLCCAIVQTTTVAGAIEISATAPGLATATVTVATTAVIPPPGID